MNNTVAGLLVQAFAVNARLSGMQAKNQQRISNGEAPAYDETDFSYEAVALDGLSQSIMDAASYN